MTFTLSILHPATKEVLEKATFSKLFNREVHSWGKNNFVSIRGLSTGQYTGAATEPSTRLSVVLSVSWVGFSLRAWV